MITVRIKGGLGNQLFQYAAGYAMARRLNTQMKMDVSFFGTQSLRGFKLDCFRIDYPEIADSKQLPIMVKFAKEKHIGSLMRDITRPHKKKSFRVGNNYRYLLESGSELIDEFFTAQDENIYLDGYYQSQKYFEGFSDEIKRQLSVRYEPDNEYVNQMEILSEPNSVALHVRRGDVAAAKRQLTDYAYVLSPDYYRKAIMRIKQQISSPKFFCFSDDIEWVKDNLGITDDIHFVSLHTPHADIDEMMLMKNCNHIITANSTFSWWAAWLNEHEDAIRIVPEKPYGNNHMIPEGWIKVPVE